MEQRGLFEQLREELKVTNVRIDQLVSKTDDHKEQLDRLHGTADDHGQKLGEHFKHLEHLDTKTDQHEAKTE